MIEIKNIDKSFGSFKAVINLSINVEKGEVLGLLGPNGAGKSTSMRIITGFLQADRGSVTIGGFDSEKQGVKARQLIGYLPESAPCYGEMNVDAFLDFIAAIRGLRGAKKKVAVSRVIETCFLGAVAKQTISTLSKGYTHRTCFAQALIHDPDVLILDEPTDGLDPNQKYEVRNLIKKMGETKAIIISTHILEEVDAVCSRVAIMNNGKVVFDGFPFEMRALSKNTGSVMLRVLNQSPKEVLSKFKYIEGVSKVILEEEGNDSIVVRLVPKAVIIEDLSQRIFEYCRQEKWSLTELRVDEGNLEQVFRQLTIGSKNKAMDETAPNIEPVFRLSGGK